MILLRVVSSTMNQRVTEFLRSPTVARQRRQGTKRKDMNDRGTYDGVPTRLKVADVLVNYGKDVSFTRSGLIKSPFRDERTPSFHILAGGYGWVDFWDGTKGGVIDLVMRLEHCDRTFAVRRLAEMRNGGRLYVPSGQQDPRPACRRAPSLKVVSSSYVSDGTLLRYASGRGISEDVLRMYCREVAVRMGRSGSVQSYIGFPNNGDGHVLRSAVSGPGGKRCTNSAPTYLAHDGIIGRTGRLCRSCVRRVFRLPLLHREETHRARNHARLRHLRHEQRGQPE